MLGLIYEVRTKSTRQRAQPKFMIFGILCLDTCCGGRLTLGIGRVEVSCKSSNALQVHLCGSGQEFGYRVNKLLSFVTPLT